MKRRANITDDVVESNLPKRRRLQRNKVASKQASVEDENAGEAESTPRLSEVLTSFNLCPRLTGVCGDRAASPSVARSEVADTIRLLPQAQSRPTSRRQSLWAEEQPLCIYVAAYFNDVLTPGDAKTRLAMGVHAFEWNVRVERPTIERARGTEYSLATDWAAVGRRTNGYFPKDVEWRYCKEERAARSDALIGMLKIGHAPTEEGLSDYDEVHELCRRAALEGPDTTYTWTTDVVMRLWTNGLIWTGRPVRKSDWEHTPWFEDLLAVEIQDWFKNWSASKTSTRRKGNVTIRECMSGGQ